VYESAWGGYARWWWGRESQVEALQKKSLVWVGLGITAQAQGAAIGGRKVHLQPLDTGELVEYGTGGQTWGYPGFSDSILDASDFAYLAFDKPLLRQGGWR
jgi:hypothetical protein